LNAVEAKRSTWSSWNVDAEAARQIATTGAHFASASDLIAVRDRVARSALDRSVLLNPTAATRELGMGIAGAEPAAHRVFTSLAVLAAEDRLLAAADDRSGPVAAPIPSTALVRDPGLARMGNAEPVLFEIASRAMTSAPTATLTAADPAQAAVAALAASGRVADVLVGPAGAGKSTAMRQLRETWEATFGPGSVTGLAPSAAAARVLGAETGTAAETTAQWIAQQAGEARRLNTLIDLQRRREKRVAAVGFSSTERSSADRATRSRTAIRSAAVAKWAPVAAICRAASASTFQLLHVDRFASTAFNVAAARISTSRALTAPAERTRAGPALRVTVCPDHSSMLRPMIEAARARHSRV
jgi:hypothetical protein